MLKSKRLQLIADIIEDDYDCVWDCCCDHGLLGLEVLRKSSAVVHFVDCEQPLIDKLKTQLARCCYPADRWRTLCQDICTIEVSEQKKQLFVIAGVGGDTCIEMVRALLDRYPNRHFDFILCPVRQLELVRETLSAYSVGLVSDYFIEERGRYYEVLFLRQHHSRSLGVIAQDFWQQGNSMQQRYVESRIHYFSHRSGASDQRRSVSVLRSYQSLFPALF